MVTAFQGRDVVFENGMEKVINAEISVEINRGAANSAGGGKKLWKNGAEQRWMACLRQA
ncbi:hypothetical protein [Herbaspirillum sp. meg3]|uniref:hypothetical protein n=1 Tax=Herbaspirillum sp. meg3 TaxID=2025949 RepID=UPI0012FDE909|nr:hypothetical protein [Herbaspirillum sp. meg3]